MLADKHKNAVYLGERDCSVGDVTEVIEESPAQGIPRKLIGRSASAARRCKRIGYRGEHVQFLYETASSTSSK